MSYAHVTVPGLMPIGRRRSRDVPVFAGLLVSGFHASPVAAGRAGDEPPGRAEVGRTGPPRAGGRALV